MEEYRIEHIFSKRQISRAIYVIEKENKKRKNDMLNPADLRNFWENNGKEILEKIYMDEYRPAPLQQIIIKKGDKKRCLALPATLDKMLQKTTAHSLYNYYEKMYSEYSFGFRKKRSTTDAIRKCLEYVNAGNSIVLKLDIRNYFDRINHDILRDVLLSTIDDGRIVAWIMRIVKTPIYVDGELKQRQVGVGQGSPLSPCLANVYLNEFDKWLEEKKVKFVRYADDVVLFFRDTVSAENMLKEVICFMKKNLCLQINSDKTYIATADKLKFLGFGLKKRLDTYVCVPDDKNVEMQVKKIYSLSENKTITKNKKWEIMTISNMGWVSYYKRIKREDIIPELRKIDTYEMFLLSGDNFLEDAENYKVVLSEAWYDFFSDRLLYI